jgi:hypothetical protein
MLKLRAAAFSLGLIPSINADAVRGLSAEARLNAFKQARVIVLSEAYKTDPDHPEQLDRYCYYYCFYI